MLLGGLLLAIGVAFLALAIPPRSRPVPPAPPRGMAFAWDRDAFWDLLQRRFEAAGSQGCPRVEPEVAAGLARLDALLDSLVTRAAAPDDPTFDLLETGFFEAGTGVAACPGQLAGYVALYGRLRAVVKDQSHHWDLAATPVRSRLYRSLYGARAAVEEVLMHHPAAVPMLMRGREEPSAAPSAMVQGVRVHSGDIVVSRGGAPTSALIARGNDYPGNFSHIGLVHVDEATGHASVVEAHIERGVAVATPEQYLSDTKLRIMLLRPRADLPAIRADPLLPHRAADTMLRRARDGHVPYDFAMDYTDPARLFCSEVASWGYREHGVTLWSGLSTISAPGLRRWLAGFGVAHFETQEPSDLEYDPQLVVVAEWRDPASLAQDRVDNAVIDAMLEGAERGDALEPPWYLLPAGRLAKGYSWLVERLGRAGPVPEGMSAAAALRNRTFSARQRAHAERVRAQAERWEVEHGYPAPYWVLVAQARAEVAGPAR